MDIDDLGGGDLVHGELLQVDLAGSAVAHPFVESHVFGQRYAADLFGRHVEDARGVGAGDLAQTDAPLGPGGDGDHLADHLFGPAVAVGDLAGQHHLFPGGVAVSASGLT